jgi:hypothetical protein
MNLDGMTDFHTGVRIVKKSSLSYMHHKSTTLMMQQVKPDIHLTTMDTPLILAIEGVNKKTYTLGGASYRTKGTIGKNVPWLFRVRHTSTM